MVVAWVVILLGSIVVVVRVWLAKLFFSGCCMIFLVILVASWLGEVGYMVGLVMVVSTGGLSTITVGSGGL